MDRTGILFRHAQHGRRALKRWLGHPPPIVSANPALQALVANLGPGDVAIDCGANVGEVTEALAWRGARVFAFEPNPFAFARLKERFRLRANVTCRQAAVGTEAGSLPLYLHVNSKEDPVHWSTGSSLLREKGNVDPETFVTVPVVDLAEFLVSLGGQIALLKLDIEGAEIALLDHLLVRGVLTRAKTVLVERHDNKIPELALPMARLLDRLKAEGCANVHFDWH